MNKLLLMALLCVFVGFSGKSYSYESEKGMEIPRSYTDPFRYFLISKTKKGGIITTLSKQVGRTVIDHRKSLVNCKNKTYKILMEGENINDMYKIKNSQWTEIVDGSSMADMVYFVCK